jgi:hypothetical protein
MGSQHATSQRKGIAVNQLGIPQMDSCSAGMPKAQQRTTASGTTTWYGRSKDSFLELARVAEELNLRNPEIIDVGPGGMSSLTSELFSFAAKISNQRARYFCIKALKSIDTLVRNCFKSRDLVTAEPFELLAALERLEPRSIIVVDKNPAVIKAFETGFARMGTKTPRISLDLDLEQQGITRQGDIVIAKRVLNRRTIERHKLVENVCGMVRSGGLLCMNIDHCPEGFTPHGRFWRKL